MTNRDNFYFKHLDIPYTDSEIDEFKKAYYAPITEFRKVNDIDHIRILLPSIFKWFDEHKLEVHQAFIISYLPRLQQRKHVDFIQSGSKLAINILVTPGAKNSITRFFELKDPSIVPELKYTENTNLPYSEYDDNNLNPITFYNMKKPVMLNTSKIHSVMNITDSHRSVISFRFKENPWHLIEDEI